MKDIAKNRIISRALFIPVIAFLFPLNSVFCQVKNVPHPVSEYSVSRHIKYGYTLQNNTAGPVKGVRFKTFAPLEKTSGQYLTKIGSTHNYSLTAEPCGNQVMEFIFDVMAPNGIRIVSITADLSMALKSVPVRLADPSAWLKSEPFIEIEDPGILKTARRLETSDPVETARKIFQYVSTHVRYSGYTSKARGAKFAFYNRQGDCTEFMYLFVAMCRAVQIPARGIGGYVVASNGKLRPSGYHNWAEFYGQGAWQLADPQRKIFMKNIESYIAMRIVGYEPEDGESFHRFSIIGKGISVGMNN